MRASWALSSCLLLAAVTLAACGEDSSLRIVVAAPPVESPASSAAPVSSAPALNASPKASATPKPALGVDTAPAPVGVGGPAMLQAISRALPASTRIQIPSIQVDAPLVSLGVDPDGTMQAPGNGVDVGWYTFSALPGTRGNAVLSGHLDTATSRVAVFSQLRDLKQGDPMSIVENGQKIDFEVFWTKSWADQVIPLPLVLGNAPSPTLTLITCSGVFDRASRNYSERLVVRAKLPGSL